MLFQAKFDDLFEPHIGIQCLSSVDEYTEKQTMVWVMIQWIQKKR